MGERWVTLRLRWGEALICHKCYKTIEDQEVHMYVNVDHEIDEVICEMCFFFKDGKTLKESN